jgi:hypothetical protein
MENNDDRRMFPRFNLLVDVSIAKRASSEKEQTFASKNISQGGVCIITFEKPDMGDLMDLRIRLPGKKDEIKTIGKVTWVKEVSIGPLQKTKRFEVGLEFVGLNDTTFGEFNKYLYNNPGQS